MELKIIRDQKWNSVINLQYIAFLAGWLIINLLQAWFSDLHYDEAYYWFYSRHMAWGYFDHPPMVALLIKIGYFIFHNQLGVRLLFVLMGTATMGMICYLIQETRKTLFLFFFLLTIPLLHLHVCGFIAIPDTPMVFFSTVFLLLYKEFLEKDTYKLSILLGIVGALMIYSKYHGVLVILFTLLSNISLLKNRKTWIALIICCLLLIPHLWWQYTNQFPTFNFQLVRRIRGIGFNEPMIFSLSQLALAGFLTGSILIYLTITRFSVNAFEKTLKWNVLGIMLFFLAFSFKMGVEAHWTAAAFPPLIYLSFISLRDRDKLIRWFKPLAFFGLFIIIIMRLIIASDLVADKLNKDSGFNHWKKFSANVDKVAKGRNVLFISSYRRPPEYTFYSKKQSSTVAQIYGHSTEYDLLNHDELFIHKPVMMIWENLPIKSDSTFKGDLHNILFYKTVPDYFPYHKFELLNDGINISSRPGDSVKVSMSVKSKFTTLVFLSKDTLLKPQFGYIIYGGTHRLEHFIPLSSYLKRDTLRSNEIIPITMNVKIPVEKGNYSISYGIIFGDKLRGKMSKPEKINILP